jgi:hypothetical protein
VCQEILLDSISEQTRASSSAVRETGDILRAEFFYNEVTPGRIFTTIAQELQGIVTLFTRRM